MKLALLSDTHDLLRPEVLAELSGADAIVHNGTVTSKGWKRRLE